MIQTTRRQWLLGTGVIALLSGGYAWSRFRHALKTAEQRVSHKSSTISTPFGTLEYAVDGLGAPVLMIHGTGGGFDQGLRFGSALRQRGHRIIAPSRFGYLRSDFPADPSLINQADAFVTLLDHLGIDRLPVIGGSAGALSATAFALRHPDRCTALILLVPAANVSGSDPVEMTALQQKAVRILLNSDFSYWLAVEAAPERLIGTLLATDPHLLSTVSASERRRAFAILSDMMPVHARARGMLNDARQAGHPAKMNFSRLNMPVLVISAEDDRFGTAATARQIAEIVPHAELTILADGGHIWLGHDDQVASRMETFISSIEEKSVRTGPVDSKRKDTKP
jgi:2-hydroxy-6-oxonona-2,4-dienedioate hydrolase